MIKQYKIKVNGKVYEVEVEELEDKATIPVVQSPKPQVVQTQKTNVETPKPQAVQVVDSNDTSIKSSMPGTVLSFKVSVGDKVSEGDVIVILEAMKMENEIVSPVSGTVKAILVEQGSSVVEGQVLLQIG